MWREICMDQDHKYSVVKVWSLSFSFFLSFLWVKPAVVWRDTTPSGTDNMRDNDHTSTRTSAILQSLHLSIFLFFRLTKENHISPLQRKCLFLTFQCIQYFILTNGQVTLMILKDNFPDTNTQCQELCGTAVAQNCDSVFLCCPFLLEKQSLLGQWVIENEWGIGGNLKPVWSLIGALCSTSLLLIRPSALCLIGYCWKWGWVCLFKACNIRGISVFMCVCAARVLRWSQKADCVQMDK